MAALAFTVNAALVRSVEDGKKKPVYFVSKELIDVETRYTDFERIALAFRMASKKLRPYFQAHIIVVLTSYPVRAVLHKSYALGRLLKWAMKLSEFNIEYRLRSTIKGQALADFIIEMSDVQPWDLGEKLWILETDGLSRIVEEGAEMNLQSPKHSSITQAVKFAFVASNNEAEYDIMLLGL